MAMGAADAVPGISGGTIALLLGIYKELINTIGNINISLLKDGAIIDGTSSDMDGYYTIKPII